MIESGQHVVYGLISPRAERRDEGMMDRKRFWPHTYVSRLDVMNLRNVYERGCAIKRVWWRPKPVDPDAPIVKLGKAISLLDES